MARNESRKYQRKIEQIKAIVGADIERDLLQVALGGVDVDAVPMTTNISEPLNISLDYVAGVEQSGSDLVSDIGDILEALNSNGTDYFRSELYAQDPDGNLVNLQADSNGEIEASLDAETVGVDDSTGARVDPATQALENALKANDADEFISRVAGSDGLEIEEEQLANEIGVSSIALVTYLARALESQLEDAIRSRQTSDSESRFKHDDATVQSGDSWYIPTGETWRAGNILNDGVLNVEGQIISTGSISGPGTITGSGTVTLTSYT